MDMNEIDNEIKKLECSKTTWANLDRLAVLYSVRNGMNGADQAEMMPLYSSAPAPVTGSEIAEAITSIPIEDALEVLDEHFEAVRMIYPKEYDLVLKKLNSYR